MSERVREKERTDERDRRGLWQWIFADCRRNRGIALILPCRGWAGDDRYGPAVLYDGNLWELSVQQEKNRGDQMEQVLQCYGKGIAAGIVLITVMVLLFAGIRDEQGNRGIINIVKTWIPEEETITENAAIDAFAEAGEVAYPTIRYAYNGMLHRGAYLPGDLFSAVDGMGEERSVLWCEMTDPHGNSCTIESQQGDVVFDVEGIYTVRVCATDEANRRSVCEFQIPVNR